MKYLIPFLESFESKIQDFYFADSDYALDRAERKNLLGGTFPIVF